jgi:hypothetical protein
MMTPGTAPRLEGEADMAQYAVLIYSDETEQWSPEQEKEVTDAYWAYTDMLTSSGQGDAGEALHPTSTATTVRVRDGKTLTTDGPFIESKEALGGFYIVNADDLDGAIELAAQCPGAAHGAVEVRPVIDFSAGASAWPGDAGATWIWPKRQQQMRSWRRWRRGKSTDRPIRGRGWRRRPGTKRWTGCGGRRCTSRRSRSWNDNWPGPRPRRPATSSRTSGSS